MTLLSQAVVIREEPLADCTEELQGLVTRHWEEVDGDQAEVPLDVDWIRLQAMADSQVAFLLTARDGESLVGYLVALVGPHLHYRMTIVGMLDAFWIAPEYRRGTTGIRLFVEAEKSLKARGARKIIGQSKTDAVNDVSALFEYLGWQRAEVIFTKVV